jgi:hypothetical protein
VQWQAEARQGVALASWPAIRDSSASFESGALAASLNNLAIPPQKAKWRTRSPRIPDR